MLQLFFNVDVGNRVLLDAANNTLDAAQVKLTRGDTLMLGFTFLRKTGSTVEDYAVPAGSSLFAGLKDGGDLDAATYLAQADADQWNLAGDWDDAAAGTNKQSARFALNSAALLALFPDGTRTKTLVFEIRETDVNGFESTLCQADITVFADVIRGTEGAPSPEVPTYMTAAEVTAAIAAAVAAYVPLAKLEIPAGKKLVFAADGTSAMESAS